MRTSECPVFASLRARSISPRSTGRLACRAWPRLAFGKNPPFLPNGSVFTRIIAERAGERQFGACDLYAVYLLLDSGKRLGFGRGGSTARRRTKFLYCFVFINLLRDALQKEQLPSGSGRDHRCHYPAAGKAK
jgi:hypothetical protein